MDAHLDGLLEVARLMREAEARAIAKVQARQTGELWTEWESDYGKQDRAA